MPRLWKKWPRCAPSGAEPETANFTRPPIAARSFEYTSRSYRANLSLRPKGTEPASTARECSTATSAAARKILPRPPLSAFCSAEL